MELTHDFNVLLPLLVANVLSYTISVLVLKRSILTEKVARRGFHLSREYSVDPLEILFVRDVMRTNLVAFGHATPIREAGANVRPDHTPIGQHLYPLLAETGAVMGVVTRKNLRKLLEEEDPSRRISDFMRDKPTVAYADESLRVVVFRMASTGFTRMPVLDSSGKLVGMVSLQDLLSARVKNLSDERDRERVIRIRLPFGSSSVARKI
jgi:CBS domain-containing protein